MDDYSIMFFALAVVIGSFKFGNFSLITTGGCLIAILVFGHFGHVGNIMPDVKARKVFREFGLVFFLMGAGISGGASFIKYFEPIYFL